MDTPPTSTSTSKPTMPTIAEQYALLRKWIGELPAARTGGKYRIQAKIAPEDITPSSRLEDGEVEILRLVLPDEVGRRDNRAALARTLSFYLDVLLEQDPKLFAMDFQMGINDLTLRDEVLEPGLQRVALRPDAIQTQGVPTLGDGLSKISGTKYSLAGVDALAFLAYCPSTMARMRNNTGPCMSLPGLRSPEASDSPTQLLPGIHLSMDTRRLPRAGEPPRKYEPKLRIGTCPYAPEDTAWLIPTYRTLGPVRPFVYRS